MAQVHNILGVLWQADSCFFQAASPSSSLGLVPSRANNPAPEFAAPTFEGPQAASAHGSLRESITSGLHTRAPDILNDLINTQPWPELFFSRLLFRRSLRTSCMLMAEGFTTEPARTEGQEPARKVHWNPRN